MKKIYHVLLFLPLLWCAGLSAQNDVTVGQWKTHFSYSEGVDLLRAENAIYVATSNTVFTLDLTDGLYTRLGVTEGLSDVGISHIHWDDKSKTLLVCYANSNMDLYSDGQFYNLSDLYRKQMTGDKSLYAACIADSKAYLACGFGIMVVDMKKRYIQDTWFFSKDSKNLAVKDVCLKGDTLFAATAQGIFYNTLDNRKISQFSTWVKVVSQGLPDSMETERLETYGDVVYAVRAASVDMDTVWESDTAYRLEPHPRSNSFYAYEKGRWRPDTLFGYEEVRNVRVSNSCLVVTFWNKASVYRRTGDGGLVRLIEFGSPQPCNALYGDDGYIWIADAEEGLVRQLWTDLPAYYRMEGPLTDGVWAMDANRSALAVIHSAPHIGWVPRWSQILLSTYDGSQWNNARVDFSYSDGMDVLLTSSKASECYITSYVNGLVKVREGQVVAAFDSSNSTLEPYYGNVRCTRMAMDSNANLWVLNPFAAYPLSMLTPKGEWYHYNIQYASGTLMGSLLVDSRGWIWMTGHRETSLLILDPNGTPTNTSDDRLVMLNTTLTEETGAFSFIYALAEDKDGEIWLGTDRGIKIYYSPSRLLDYPSTLPYAPRVSMDSLTELLLYHETVTCIKVDQGNRKWVGTENAGLFLLSEDGETELLHFTKENSPLISNNIRDIAILGSTGEVFIGTDKGLESFRYTATDPEADYTALKVFPNPVREDFDGLVSISGLVDDSEVKITDTKGGLVYRTRSNGGTAVWDGRRFDGSKAATGVYFVHASDASGKIRGKGKILLIK